MGRFTRRPAQEQRERERLQELESTERTPCNWDIQTEEVRLVGEGKEHSIMKLKDAIERAQQQELDLVQVCVFTFKCRYSEEKGQNQQVMK